MGESPVYAYVLDHRLPISRMSKAGPSSWVATVVRHITPDATPRWAFEELVVTATPIVFPRGRAT